MKQPVIVLALLFLGACGNDLTKSSSTDESSTPSTSTALESSGTDGKAGVTTTVKNNKKHKEQNAGENQGRTSGNGNEQGGEDASGQPRHEEVQPPTTPGETSPVQPGENNPGPSPGNKLMPNKQVPVVTPDPLVPVDEGPKGVIFVGSTFAQWKKSSGQVFDGSFDPSQSLFKVCQADRLYKIQSNELTFPQFGECDEPVENRIQMYPIKKDGTLDGTGHPIKVAGTKGEVTINGVTRSIQLDASTLQQINKAKHDAFIKSRPLPGEKTRVDTPPANDPPVTRKPLVVKTIDQKPVEKEPTPPQPSAVRQVPPSAEMEPTPAVKEKVVPAVMAPGPAPKTTGPVIQVLPKGPAPDTARKATPKQFTPMLKGASPRTSKIQR